jgi:hypothetical protein
LRDDVLLSSLDTLRKKSNLGRKEGHSLALEKLKRKTSTIDSQLELYLAIVVN